MRAPRTRSAGAPRGFVLLEVLIAVTILGVTVATVMRSFTQSLTAVRLLEVQAKSSFFALQLMDELEINPPEEEGTYQGWFGEAHPAYSYTYRVEYEDPGYKIRNMSKDIERLFPVRHVHIEIYHDRGRGRVVRAVSLDTAIIGFERFSVQAKRQLLLF